MSEAVIDILLATFRGERWLPAQLDSLLAQTFTDWRVIVRDDNSGDGTRSLLEAYAARYPGRFLLLPEDGRNRRACGNFAELLRYSTAPYIAFCDQDDVWHPERLARGLTAIQTAEQESPEGTPILVHGDLRVVDAGLNLVTPSFARMQRLNLERGCAFHRLLMQNVVTGCSVTINRALASKADPIPDEAVMHDYWLALVAAAFGRCIVLDDGPLVDYRQHDSNTIGAQDFSAVAIIRDRKIGQLSDIRQSLAARERQARAFSVRYADVLSASRQTELSAFLRLFTTGFVLRRLLLLRHGFWKHGWIRNVGLLALM